MSEEGWREFLAAAELGDWVILHGGPTAVFRTGSLQEAARLAMAIADVPGLESRTVLTATADGLTIKLSRELWATEAHHVGLAHTISAIAREHGATPDRGAVQEVQLAIAAMPDAIDLGFWRAVLGYAPMADDNGIEGIVIDNGPGIPEEELPRVFERFYRLEKSRVRGEDGRRGSGLGLAIVEELVHAHGGRISVNSRVGEGTTLVVSLPTAAAD